MIIMSYKALNLWRSGVCLCTDMCSWSLSLSSFRVDEYTKVRFLSKNRVDRGVFVQSGNRNILFFDFYPKIGLILGFFCKVVIGTFCFWNSSKNRSHLGLVASIALRNPKHAQLHLLNSCRCARRSHEQRHRVVASVAQAEVPAQARNEGDDRRAARPPNRHWTRSWPRCVRLACECDVEARSLRFPVQPRPLKSCETVPRGELLSPWEYWYHAHMISSSGSAFFAGYTFTKLWGVGGMYSLYKVARAVVLLLKTLLLLKTCAPQKNLWGALRGSCWAECVSSIRSVVLSYN